MQLSDLLNQSFRTLSEGQKQRVLLARTLVSCPSLVMLDEPASAMDPMNAGRLFEAIRTLADERKLSFVVSSHHMEWIVRIADSAIMLVQGLPVADGTLEEVKQVDHPEIRAFFDRVAAGEMRGSKSALELLTGDR